MQLRKAAYSDWKNLLRWRNDPLTRKNCLTDDLVEESNHKKWLESALQKDDLILLVALENEIPVGTIRGELDQETNIYKVSWTTAPEFRNQGIAKKMAQLFKKNYSEEIRVEIKKEDLFSVKIAEYIGLRFKYNINDILHYSA